MSPNPPRPPAPAHPLARLHAILGTPGLMIGLMSLLAFAFGLIAAARGYDQLRDTGRGALRRVITEWVRITPVDYLSRTLKDHAHRWQQADPAGRDAQRPGLRDRLAELGHALIQPGGPEPLIAIVSMELAPRPGPPLARWSAAAAAAGPDPRAFRDRIPVLDAGPDVTLRPAIDLDVRYHLAPVVERAGTELEATYHRLWLAILGLSGYSLLCLAYMVGHARALRDRVARESAQEATLDLADRTCHELGNVVFVLANERRNLDGHLDLLDRFLAEAPAARAAAARRAGLDPAQAARFEQSLSREHAERGIEPAHELAASASMARDVCRQVAVCTEYIALTVRELDGYLRQSALPVTPEPLAVADCLDDALALLAPRLDAAGAIVERPATAPAGLRVLADRRLLVHVLVNLLKNAVEAAAAAGLPPRIRLDARVDGPTAWITVADAGPGIPAAELPRVFDLGYSTKGAGRGRGLAIVRESIAAQGGELRVTSHPDAGTEFRIGLPLAEEMTPPGCERSAGVL